MSETNIPEEVLAAASDVETKESEVIETQHFMYNECMLYFI